MYITIAALIATVCVLLSNMSTLCYASSYLLPIMQFSFHVFCPGLISGRGKGETAEGKRGRKALREELE